jgi:hypothetical protein
LRPATAADYTVVGNPTGNIPRSGGETYSVEFIDLIGQPSVLESIDGAPSGGAMWLTGPREREYFGGTVSFTKRLANNWMARGFFNYGDAEWSVPSSDFIDCPLGFANNRTGGGCRDGDLYMTRAFGSGKGERFLQSTWSFNLNGMYQIASDRSWGFNVSANINGREGFPIAYYDRSSSTYGSVNQNVMKDLDRFRLDDPITADLRIEKEFAVSGPVSLTFGIDLFNAFNANTGMSYQAQTDLTTAGFLLDNISPRIWRLGVRLNWR